MMLYNNAFQKQLAEKFAKYFHLDLSFMEMSLDILSSVDKLTAISLIDIESKLVLVAYCDDEFILDKFTTESIDIFLSTQRMLEAYNVDETEVVHDVVINTNYDFSVMAPFKMLKDREFLLYVQVANGDKNRIFIQKIVKDIVRKLKKKYD